jgi:DNA excision repair protein ERCC-3
MFGNGRARSGIIVLPCGAGKTLTGVTAAQTIKKSCVCLATNPVSVLQWKYQFQKWTNIPDDRISVFTSDQKESLHPDACVLVTTYTMISYSGKRSEESQKVMDQITGREWGILLMDEVHVVPAKMFRRVIGSVKAHTRLGLTATLVREDDLISDLNFLIGPKLYEANWMDLTAQGYLANVQCVEVWCPMSGSFMKEYLMASNARLKQCLYVLNPNKLRCVEFLVRFHEERGDKIIVFSDLVYSLKLYAEMLKRPLIYGETPERERQAILGTFRATDALRTICISKVGDTSIDLPEANVIVQVSSHFGSRRQEAQRLGRILRPKSYTQQDGSNRSSFNAFFYTLVSADTQEMFYSAKRQQYLIDQGYTFKIVTNLCDKAAEEAVKHNYTYSTAEQDRNLLRTVLNSETDLDKEQRSEDTAIRKNNPDAAALADSGTKRMAGMTMSQVSGGSGMRYKEVKSTKKHPLFRKRQRR